MVQVALPRRRSWAGTAWLIVSAASVLIALMLGYTLVLLVALATAVIAGIVLLLRVAPDPAPARPAPVGIGQAPRARRDVWKADGTARQALLVPAQAVDGYQTVLTIDGYALVNAEGRVVYALNREARANAGEPVVVTVLDEEVAAH